MSDQMVVDVTMEKQDQVPISEQNVVSIISNGPVNQNDCGREMVNLTCKTCQKRFSDPRLLPCLHSFCAECIRSFEPYIISSDDKNPNLSNSTSSLSSISNTVVTVMCPICETEVDLPRHGVYELPVDFMLRRQLLQEALNPDANDLPCDLCEEEAAATSRCTECTANLCSFCSQAHNRQRKTSSHKVISLEDVRKEGVDGLWSPLKCQSHIREEQRLFCETCDKTVCRDCCIIEHRDHSIVFNDEIVDENRILLVKLITKTEPHITTLQHTLDKIDEVNNEIDAKKESVIQEIDAFITSYIAALQKHKNQLLDKVNKVCEGKKQALKAQQLHIKQTLQDIQHSCSITKKALAEGNNDEFLSVKPLLARRMMDFSRLQVHSSPRADAFLKFLPELSSELDSFEVFGDIESKIIDPTKCSANGDGLYVAREAEEAEFCVIVRDSEGKECPQGAEDINVEIIPRGRRNGLHVPVDIEDEDDGSHRVYYTPEEPGQYFVSVFINAQHIQGSPFMVNVQSEWKEHSGKFHCCTFCSSEGRKDVTCACGATMPGGFKGCGHGHEGHPGKPHWSCCGRLDENSDCARVFNEPSKMKTVSV